MEPVCGNRNPDPVPNDACTIVLRNQSVPVDTGNLPIDAVPGVETNLGFPMNSHESTRRNYSVILVDQGSCGLVTTDRNVTLVWFG